MKLPLFLVCLASLAVPFTGRADTLVVPVVADTFIVNSNPNNNAGATGWFDAGTDGGSGGVMGVRRGLLRFDLGALPVGATVTSVVLQLTTTKVPGFGSVDSAFALYRLSAGWAEGTKSGTSGTAASPGESTWNARMSGTTTWTTPGAADDAIATPSASVSVGSARLTTYSWSGAGMVSDVEFWLADPSRNFGWLLRSDNEAAGRTARGFGSREDTVNPPVLTVGYTLMASSNSPPSVTLTAPTNGASFSTAAPVTITAEATDADGSVTNVTFFDGGTSLTNVTSPPYSITALLNAGSHDLSAVAEDNLGAKTTSSSISISVGTAAITDPIPARIPKGSITVELQTIADGMAAPLGMAAPDDGSGRMFVYDQDGRIYVVAGNTRLSAPLLDVTERLVQLGALGPYDERGLLGLAVHTNFAQNPLVYTYTSEPTNRPADFQTGVNNDHQSVIAEWRISSGNSNVVDVSSRREILRIDKPQSNHNAGTMRFGPDGMLYVTLGDGGEANDVGAGHAVGGNAQDLNRIWGKVIRIDPDGRSSANGQYGVPTDNPFFNSGGLPEIFASGFRNPFAFSFDRGSGKLYLADVGQNSVEEVNIINSGGNYGWNLREGSFWFDPSSGSVVTDPVRPPPPGLIDPIANYDHDDGIAVIGGYVYRGTALPELGGRYVFGDWGSYGAPSGRLFYLDSTNGINELRIGGDDRPMGLWLRGFGEGSDGELYAFGSRWIGPSGNTGRMVKLVPAATSLAITGITSAGDNTVNCAWAGGAGPFALQRKVALTDEVWMNTAITNGQSASALQATSSGFVRVRDAAHMPPIPFTAFLTGANERATNNSTGTGFGICSLDGNTLTFNIGYSGLSGTAIGRHIHGPANTSSNAPVLIDLAPYNGGAWGSNGTLSGVLVLTDTQKSYLMAGLTYVNLHTPSFTGGEIRGQLAPVNMQVALNGRNEIPAVDTRATGLGNLSLVGNQLTFNVTYKNLSGPANASHIHGPATQTQNTNVLIGLDPYNGGAYGTSGTLSGTVTLDPVQLGYVIDGATYLNFHTDASRGGEIRGQILPHVTGVPLTAVLSGLAERPSPLTNNAAGNGTLSLDGDTLTFNVVYSGLSSSALAAHIHGPTNSSGSANVLVDLQPYNGGAFGTSGAFSGSARLTTQQRDAVLKGQTYINFHTDAHSTGELRGQIAPVIFTAGINGVNEVPAVDSPGSGSGTFALVRDQLAIAVTYRSLSGVATASHIHGPVGLLDSANVLVDLATYNGGAYGSSGMLLGTVPLSFSQLLNVIDGQTYINIHTPQNTSGEIRGQLIE